MTPFKNLIRATLRCTAGFACCALVLLPAKPCCGAGSPRLVGTFVGSDASNRFLVAINSSFDLPGQVKQHLAPPGIVISNGMYSIDISAPFEAPEEMLPSGPASLPININQALAIYAEIAGRELEVDEPVREFKRLILFPAHPEMTRTQAREFVEAMLLEQAGVEVTTGGNNHLVVNVRKKSPE